TNLRNVASNGMNNIVTATGNGLSRMRASVSNGMVGVRNAFYSGTANSVNAVRGFYNSFYSAGSYLGQCLRNGIASHSGSVISTVNGLSRMRASVSNGMVGIRNAYTTRTPYPNNAMRGFYNKFY